MKSKRVLELGCGVGFLGIVIAALQTQDEGHFPSSLHLTDSNDTVLSRCRDNFRLPCSKCPVPCSCRLFLTSVEDLSSHHPDVHIQNLDWFASLDACQRDALDSLIRSNIRPDIIIGADIVCCLTNLFNISTHTSWSGI